MTAKVNVFPLIIAENMWTLPYLSIGMVAAYLRVHDEGRLNHHYNIARPTLGGVESHSVEHLLSLICSSEQPICLLSSYVWNHRLNMEVASQIRQTNPGALIIVGGPEIPKYEGVTETFLRDYPAIDIAVLGEGEVACAEILSGLNANLEAKSNNGLSDVAGIVYRVPGGAVRTRERQRMKDINTLPSPYLSGEYEPWFRGISNAVVETNRGCPYGCTYCDWGSATLQKVTRFDPQRVIDEVEYIAGTQAPVIFIADANFGMLEQDIEIARGIVEIRARVIIPFLTDAKSRCHAAISTCFGGKPPLALLGRSLL